MEHGVHGQITPETALNALPRCPRSACDTPSLKIQPSTPGCRRGTHVWLGAGSHPPAHPVGAGPGDGAAPSGSPLYPGAQHKVSRILGATKGRPSSVPGPRVPPCPLISAPKLHHQIPPPGSRPGPGTCGSPDTQRPSPLCPAAPASQPPRPCASLPDTAILSFSFFGGGGLS